MKKLVTISREYGSGGRIIGRLVAEKLGIPFYDKEILDMAAEQSGLSREIVEAAELRAKSSFSYSLASAMNFGEGMIGDTVSINEKLFVAQYDVIHQTCQNRLRQRDDVTIWSVRYWRLMNGEFYPKKQIGKLFHTETMNYTI